MQTATCAPAAGDNFGYVARVLAERGSAEDKVACVVEGTFASEAAQCGSRSEGTRGIFHQGIYLLLGARDTSSRDAVDDCRIDAIRAVDCRVVLANEQLGIFFSHRCALGYLDASSRRQSVARPERSNVPTHRHKSHQPQCGPLWNAPTLHLKHEHSSVGQGTGHTWDLPPGGLGSIGGSLNAARAAEPAGQEAEAAVPVRFPAVRGERRASPRRRRARSPTIKGLGRRQHA